MLQDHSRGQPAAAGSKLVPRQRPESSLPARLLADPLSQTGTPDFTIDGEDLWPKTRMGG